MRAAALLLPNPTNYARFVWNESVHLDCPRRRCPHLYREVHP